MSFWDVTKRLLQGKPAFEVSQDSDDMAHTDPNAQYKKDLPPEQPGRRSVEPARRYDGAGNQEKPRTEMTYCHCKKKDSQSMQLWATIVNHSPINVHVERVTLCGSETAINYPLAPNQRRDFMVYTGAKPTSPHDRYSELYYKDRGTGEEFVCRHMVMFKDDQDGTFSPKGFSPLIVINSQRPASL